MKSETKIIIVLSFIVALLAGVFIFREFKQARKNRTYQDNIEQLETETKELRDTNKQLRTDIQTVENERNEAIETIRENGAVISRLENENNSFRKNTKGLIEDITELEKLLSEFFAD